MNHVGNVKKIRGLSSMERFGRLSFFVMSLIVLIFATICCINAIKCVNKPFPGFLLTERMVVGGVGQYHWTGVKVGLKHPDKILKANNQILSSVGELEQLINSTDVGTPINYVFKRDGQLVEFTIPTMRFTLTDILVIFGIPFLTGFIYLLIGAIVFIMKPDIKTSFTYLLFCLFLSTYSILLFDLNTTRYFIKWFFISAQALVPAGAIHLSLFFPEEKKFIKRHQYLEFIPYIISIILIILCMISYPGPIFAVIYSSLTWYIVLGALALFVSTFSAYFRNTSIIARQRAKVALVGAAFAFPVPASILFLSLFGITYWGVQVLYNFLELPLLIFPAAIAYAIARHNLFDVDVFIKRTVGYIIMTIVVGAAYFATQTLLTAFVLRPVMGDSAEKVYPIIFALLVIFLFNPFNQVIQGFIDKLFYRKKFDYKETIAAVSDSLSSMLNQNTIIGQLIDTVRNDMFVDTAGVILIDKKNNRCQSTFIDDDTDEEHKREVTIAYDDPLLTLLATKKKLITKYDVAEDPHYADVKEACGKRFLEMDISVVVPFIYQEEVKGAFALGHKKSGHFYSRDDIGLVETLASQGIISIENARLFEENLEKGRMEEELKIGHEIQMGMLPERAPETKGFQIAARSIPAREVGGDFYDFIDVRGEKEEDKLAIVVGDVSGKGVSAGLVMAASRSTYRGLSTIGLDHYTVQDVMALGNQRLNADIKKGMFVALLYAVLSPAEKVLTLSNAGQTKPILCTDGEAAPSYIDTEGDTFPLGIIPDCQYLEKRVLLKGGDTVVFYTDGIVEAMNKKEEMYGFDRFMNTINDNRELGADPLLEKLMEDVTAFVGGARPHDDLTIIVLKAE